MNENKLDHTDNEWVYIAEAFTQSVYKIGYAKNVSNRLSSLQTSSPHELRVFHKFQTANSREAENALHKIFKEKKVRGEWYRLTPVDLAFISQISDYNSTFIWQNVPVNIEDIEVVECGVFTVTVSDIETSGGEYKDVTLTEREISDFLIRAWRKQENQENGLSYRFWFRRHDKKISPEQYRAIIKLLDKNGLILNRKKRYSGRLAMPPTECLLAIKNNAKD
jgi:hypothetical protein